MKARLVPLYFDPGRDAGFDRQLDLLGELLGPEADFAPPLPLGAPLPDCDAVLFPQLLGEAYRQLPALRALRPTILILTSEAGTLSMWDWELCAYLRTEGLRTLAPSSLPLARTALRALGLKRTLRESRFVVYQDNPGNGQQAPIFKRFYWWEAECTQRILDKFGLRIEVRSFKALAQAAARIPDSEAHQECIAGPVPSEGLGPRSLNSATKLYLALRRELDQDPSIRGMGINCLNESHLCDTTPCLAWSRLHDERGLIWGCEADTVSMLTQQLLQEALQRPAMLTNLYPFLMGEAALRHERIPNFPQVEGDPANHLLVGHCGYLGVLPRSFASEWSLRPKVLRIVDGNAAVIDARLPAGPVTLAKLDPGLKGLAVVEGRLKGYAQFPGSDCLNGGIVEVTDGRRLLQQIVSHHYILMTGHERQGLDLLAAVFDLAIEEA